jgi:tetratricopeptide (TPR) repeat protein
MAVLSVARADSPNELEAKQHYAAAQKLFLEAHFKEALAEYQDAWALSGYPAILYKIALCQDQLGQYASAIDSYTRYLDADTDSNRRAAIEERVEKLRKILASPPAIERPPEAKRETPAIVVEQPPPPQKRRPVYKKWWLWTVVGVAAAGGIVAGVAAALTPADGTPHTQGGNLMPALR